MKHRFLLVTLFAPVALAGCGLTTPRDTGNAHRVPLSPLPAEKFCNAHVSGSVIVSYPEVPDTLDTSRIALIDKDGRWDYFAGMSWADFLSAGIQSALISSFSSSGNFGTVYSDDTLTTGRFRFESEVHKFEAVYHAGQTAPEAEIEILFTLRDAGSLSVSRHFTASSLVQARANNAAAIGDAFERAFADIQRTAMAKLLSCNP